MIIRVNNKEYSFDGYVNPINSVQKLAVEIYQQGRLDAIYEMKAELIDLILGNEEFMDWQKEKICLCLECAIDELKEQKE